MSTWAIAVCACLYLLTAIDLYSNGRFGLSLTFFAYALGNVGLLWAARSGTS